MDMRPFFFLAWGGLAALSLGCGGGFLPLEKSRGEELFSLPGKKAEPPSGGTQKGEFPRRPPGLEAYVRMGLAGNPGLRAAFDAWRAAARRVEWAAALPEPALSWTHFVEALETRTGPQRNQLGLSQALPWPGKLRAKKKVAAARAEALWARALKKRAELVRDIRKAWYEYAWLGRAVEITRSNLDLLKLLEPVVQRRVQAGGNQSEILRLQVEIGKVQNRLESLEDSRPALSAALAALVGWKGRALLPWPVLEESEPARLDRERLVALLFEKNPDLAVLDKEVAIRGEEVGAARMERYPDFRVGLSWFQTGGARSGGVRGSGNDPWAFSIGVKIPLWVGKYDTEIRAARASREAALGRLKDAKNNLFSSLELALYRERDAERRVALYRDSLVPRALRSYEVTRKAYEAGKADLLDTVDQLRLLLEFRLALWRARADRGKSLAEIEALCGGEIR